MSRSPPEESGDPHVCSGMVGGNPSLVWLSHVQTGVQVFVCLPLYLTVYF